MAWTAPKTWAVGEVLTAAELNEQLRDNANALHDASRCMIARRTTPSSSGGGGSFATAVWETMDADDWAGINSGQNFNIPAAGRYSAGVSFFSSGGSGTGNMQAKILHYNSSAVLQAVIAQSIVGYLGVGVECSSMALCSAGDFFVFQVAHDATGTAQLWTGRAWVKQESVL